MSQKIRAKSFGLPIAIGILGVVGAIRAEANTLLVPVTVQAADDGYFEYSALFTAGSGGAEMGGVEFDGTDNTDIGIFYPVEWFCYYVLGEGETHEIAVTGHLLDIGQNGTVEVTYHVCDGTSPSRTTIIVSPLQAVPCPPLGQYKASKTNVQLPIRDFETVVAPAIKFNPQPGILISDVVIDLDVEHANVGDLVVTLTHTSSTGETKTTDLVNRPPCDGDLLSEPEDKYYFGYDPLLEPIGVGTCPPVIAPGCYAAAPTSPDGLSIYRGQPKGDGTWDLTIRDDGAGDEGFVRNWSVHLLCQPGPLPVEEDSWGGIKARYRDR